MGDRHRALSIGPPSIRHGQPALVAGPHERIGGRAARKESIRPSPERTWRVVKTSSIPPRRARLRPTADKEAGRRRRNGENEKADDHGQANEPPPAALGLRLAIPRHRRGILRLARRNLKIDAAERVHPVRGDRRRLMIARMNEDAGRPQLADHDRRFGQAVDVADRDERVGSRRDGRFGVFRHAQRSPRFGGAAATNAKASFGLRRPTAGSRVTAKRRPRSSAGA